MKKNSLYTKIINRINRLFYMLTGIQFSLSFTSPKRISQLFCDLQKFNKLNKASKNREFAVSSLYPCYSDASENAGGMTHHYFWQDLHIAQHIHKQTPQKHVDIGSSLSGFISHVASFREIEVFDIRPLSVDIPNVVFVQADLMNQISLPCDYTDSISCLHALEHFGLGRYGDPINPKGHLIGFVNIHRILKQGGRFYFSVPLGQQRIEFHAHRVFSLELLVRMIEPLYNIDEFSYVDDQNNFFQQVDYTKGVKDNFQCKFGCAIFTLTKK